MTSRNFPVPLFFLQGKDQPMVIQTLPQLPVLKRRLHLGFLVALLVLPLIFSSCELPIGPKKTLLQEPPLVPRPPDASLKPESKDEDTAVSYADTEEIERYSPNLSQAVSRAIQLGVLKPATSDARFEPEHPMTYGEFRQWANDYQAALPPGTTPGSVPATGQADVRTLPITMYWGSYGIQDSDSLTREALCALSVFLNGQEQLARKLSPAQIQASQPGNGLPATEPTDGAEGMLSQLNDFNRISPWAQRYVALAYQNDWFQPVFNLSLAQITTDEGLHPVQAVTRGEAMLMLDILFGRQDVQDSGKAQQAAESGRLPQSGSAKVGNGPGNGTVQNPADLTKASPGQASPVLDASRQPIPLGHLQTVQEKGPNGARQALRMGGPD